MALKIKILKDVNLDYDGVMKVRTAKDNKGVISIPYDLAVKNDYFQRYVKHPDYIEIISYEEDKPKKIKETKK